MLIAADSCVDERTFAGYDALADRLFKVEYVLPERHLPGCSPSAVVTGSCDSMAMSSQAELLSGDYRSCCPPARCSNSGYGERGYIPITDSFLASTPWSEDFVNRLMRNDGTLRVCGRQHTDPEPVTPREYVQERLYHLDLLLTSTQQRRDKAVRYEVSFPGLLAQSGGRINEAFYLPELRESLKLQRCPMRIGPRSRVC